MANILDETCLGLAQAAKRIGRSLGRDVAPSTVWRWMKFGVGQPRIRLAYVRLGRRLITSEQAISRFAHQLAEADDRPAIPGTTATSPPSSPLVSSDGAAADLREAGFFA